VDASELAHDLGEPIRLGAIDQVRPREPARAHLVPVRRCHRTELVIAPVDSVRCSLERAALLRIFLSYRRDDSSAWAGRLRDALAARFGDRNIFQDVVAVRPGDTFTDAMDTALAGSDVVLAVIGPGWLASANPGGGPRLAQSDDYVRAELAAALGQEKQLIPVLVGGAAMPTAAELPEELRSLALRQAVVLRDTAWHQDVDALVASLPGRRTPRAPRRLLVAAGIVAVLAAAGIGAWLLIDNGGDSPSTSTTGTRSKAAGPTTCPPTASDEWSDLHVAGTTDVGGSDGIRFAFNQGRYRNEGSGRWYVVLRSRATNRTTATQYHYPDFYKLEAGGSSAGPDCFNIVGGQNPMDPGHSSDVLVGFETTQDPTDGVTLSLSTFGEFGRIELSPR
jgi:hypothetical protein